MKKRMAKMFLVVVLGLGFFASKDALAASVFGKVTFVGTVNEYTAPTEGFNAQRRVHISDSTCTGANNPTERWITIKSARLERFHNATLRCGHAGL
jgi:hypothetical protein